MSTAQGVESNVVVVLQSQEMRKNYNTLQYLVQDSSLGRGWIGNQNTVFVIAGGLVIKVVVLYDVMQYGTCGVLCQ